MSRKISQSILNYQFLIRKYLKPEKLIFDHKDFKAYPKSELAIAKKLFQKYNVEFWIRTELSFKLNSLAWFLTEKGKEFLEKEAKEVKIEQMLLNFNKQNQTPEISNIKFEENIEFPKEKNNNLLDFLN